MAARRQDNIIPIENLNRGGLAHSKWSGVKNSLYKLTGWDLHSTPGLLKVAQKMTRETTGALPTEFCKARLNSSNGAQYWGSSTSGKIWERPITGTWRLVHTVTPAGGEAKILGLEEYQGYIYVFTESRVHRILVSEADDNTWGDDLDEDWATFGITDSEFHPTIERNRVLYIGDGNYVAQVNGNTFSANALDIKTPLRIKSFGWIGTDVLIGTYIADNVTQTRIIRWNTWSTDFTSEDPIPEVGINAFLQADNFVIVQAGNQGNLYYYDGEKLEEYLKIPGDYSPTAYGEVYPTAVGNLGGKILFGFSNGLGNPADQGIYQIARSTRDHDYVLDMPYPVSERSGGALVLSGIEIGGILVVGTDIYASWKKKTVVTITIASPGVVTYTGHSLDNGDAIVFTTTGALPTGLTAETVYFARSTGDDTLNIYDTAAHAITGGATGRVNTSGAQSGVHTASNFGIDKLDYSNKLELAYFETRVMVITREESSTFPKIAVAYASMPDDCSLAIECSKNYAAYAEVEEVVDDDVKNIVYTEESIEATTLQVKVTPTVSSNDAPEIESAAVFPS